ncbi:MAG: hypothetical protein GY940_28335 [bacterium]|nr:hypothetical protein [bacterium]
MPPILTSFPLELKRFFSKVNLVVLLIILLISLFVTNLQINDHKTLITSPENFQEVETTYFNHLKSYQFYSMEGFRVLFISTPASVLFANPSIMAELSARINSISKLDIFSNLKKKPRIDWGLSFRFHFSDITPWLFGLAVLFYGWDLSRRKEYLQFISCGYSLGSVFYSLIAIRFILALLSFLFILSCTLGLLLIRGVEWAGIGFGNILVYIVTSSLILLFFLLWGVAAGNIRSAWKGVVALILVWFLFNAGIPAVFSYIATESTGINTTADQLENEKFRIVGEFEKMAAGKYGKFDRRNIETGRKVVEEYYKRVFVKMQELEVEFKGGIKQGVDTYYNLSLLMPTTFHNLTANELSSLGFSNLMKFYGYLIEIRGNFVRFWIDMVYYHKKPGGAVKNFIKGQENIFKAASRYPPNFSLGVVIQLVWLILLMTGSFLVTKRSLYRLKNEEMESLENAGVNLELDKDKINVFLVRGNALGKMLYILFKGMNRDLGIEGKVMLKGVNLVKEPCTERTAYLCHPKHIPGEIKVKGLIRCIARLNKVPKGDVETLLALPELKDIAPMTFYQLRKQGMFEEFVALLAVTDVTRAGVYLLDDLDSGYPLIYVLKLVEYLERLNKESVVVYLNSTQYYQRLKIDKKVSFIDGSGWFNWLKAESFKMDPGNGGKDKQKEEDKEDKETT